MIVVCFFFKQKTAYEMRISDWSSDVCSSDLLMDVVAHACECGGDRFGRQLGAGAVRQPQLGAVGVDFGRAAFVILDMRSAVADDAAVRRAEHREREAVPRGHARPPQGAELGFAERRKAIVELRAPAVAVIAGDTAREWFRERR